MTGRTHDLAAFTALNIVIITQPLPGFSMGTALFALAACFIGGLAPDLDQPTAGLWSKFPAGRFFGTVVSPIFGRHRLISHSILGLFLFGLLAKFVLEGVSSFILVDMNIVWAAFMIGFISHLVFDTFTHDGVPWFFPLKWYIGIPPIAALRLQTGGFLEKYVLFPGLLILNIYLVVQNYQLYLDLFHKLF